MRFIRLLNCTAACEPSVSLSLAHLFAHLLAYLNIHLYVLPFSFITYLLVYFSPSLVLSALLVNPRLRVFYERSFLILSRFSAPLVVALSLVAKLETLYQRELREAKPWTTPRRRRRRRRQVQTPDSTLRFARSVDPRPTMHRILIRRRRHVGNRFCFQSYIFAR